MITNDINDLIEAARAVVESMHRNISIDQDSGETYHHPPDREECEALEATLSKVVGK